MTLVSLTDCCRLLVIDPKTLRHWLSLARISVQPHPQDARLKCITISQLQLVAALHRRVLSALSGLRVPAEPCALSTPLSATSVPAQPVGQSDLEARITGLTSQLVEFQAAVTTLEHLSRLLVKQWQKGPEPQAHETLTFGHQSQEPSLEKPEESSQDQSQESCLDQSQQVTQVQSQETSLEKPEEFSQDKPHESCLDQSQQVTQDQSQEPSLEKPQESCSDQSQEPPLEKPEELTPPPIDRRKHPRVLPLVEYVEESRYVVISPQGGKLDLEPDSPEWFAWLATLPSFRFVGKHGHLTAFRSYQPSSKKAWCAHRQIRNRSYRHRLGQTPQVTLASLEMAAASLHAHV